MPTPPPLPGRRGPAAAEPADPRAATAGAELRSAELRGAELRSAELRSAELRRRMVSTLCEGRRITSEAVRQAFLFVAREQFVPEIAQRDGLDSVYRPEAALVTATDERGVPRSSSSAPAIMAPMVEALDLQPGMRVLEIGAGTGYNAAILKRLVGAAGRVTSVDLDPAVARRARRALAQTGHRCRVVVGDGRRGWPLGAPFDRIVVTASANGIPRPWCDQLTEGGLVELPLRLGAGSGAQAVVTLRREGARLRSTSVTVGYFMALRGPGNPQEPAPVAALRALGGSDPPAVLASLEGDHVRTLSPPAGRRALATLLGPGRRLRMVPPGAVDDLVAFLTWSQAPELMLCRLDDRAGVGVVTADGSSVASVTHRAGAPGWVEIRGTGDAQRLLMPHLERWEQLGCPTLDDLRITVTFDGPSRPGSPGPTATVGNGIALAWMSRRVPSS